jgi:hypothetical protein
MRQPCQAVSGRPTSDDPHYVLCGLPAVDYMEDEDGQPRWLCAEHFDQLAALGPGAPRRPVGPWRWGDE